MSVTPEELDTLKGLFRLSPRETELLGLMLEGISPDKELARRLNVTVGTVKQMCQRLFLKVGYNSKLAVAMAALRQLQRLSNAAQENVTS